jgi:hypothetical protein
MAIEDDENFKKREQALSDICQTTRHGIVDGVEFDFRHELLDPREWQMETIGIETPPYFIRRFDPLIWFPWYGEFDKAKLRREAKLWYESEEKWRRNEIDYDQLPKHRLFVRRDLLSIPVDDYIRNGTPECTIYAGDKVIVKRVDRHIFDEGLDAYTHPHDYETRYARLSVVRSYGKVEQIETPVPFRGTTELFGSGSFEHFFDRICRRISQHAAHPSGKLTFLFFDGQLAQMSAQMIERRMGEFRKLAASGDPDDPLVRNAKDACLAIAEAVRLGYHWAHTEAEFELKPLAKLARRVKAGAMSGGSKSGQERRRKRAETWEVIAKEMAKDIRARYPTLSQDKVAAEIYAGWKATTCDPRGHTTLKGLISRMEKAGELPKRQLASEGPSTD